MGTVALLIAAGCGGSKSSNDIDAFVWPDGSGGADANTQVDGAVQNDAAPGQDGTTTPDGTTPGDGGAPDDGGTPGDGGMPSGWTAVTSPTTNHLRDVWLASTTFGVAVGDSGTIVTYDGTDWTLETGVPTSEDLYGVWGSSPTSVYAAGNGGTILSFDGTSWTSVGPGGNTNFRDIGGGGGNVIAVGSAAVSDVAWMSTGGAFAVENTGATGSLYGAWGTGGQIVVVGLSGEILRRQGGNWSAMTSGVTEWLTGIHGLSGHEIWVTGDDGMILGWDGTSWTQETSNVTAHVRRVWAADSNNVFAAGYDTSQPTDQGGFILMRGTNGAWQQMTIPTSPNLWGICGTSATQIFAVGWNGTILEGP